MRELEFNVTRRNGDTDVFRDTEWNVFGDHRPWIGTTHHSAEVTGGGVLVISRRDFSNFDIDVEDEPESRPAALYAPLAWSRMRRNRVADVDYRRDWGTLMGTCGPSFTLHDVVGRELSNEERDHLLKGEHNVIQALQKARDSALPPAAWVVTRADGNTDTYQHTAWRTDPDYADFLSAAGMISYVPEMADDGNLQMIEHHRRWDFHQNPPEATPETRCVAIYAPDEWLTAIRANAFADPNPDDIFRRSILQWARVLTFNEVMGRDVDPEERREILDEWSKLRKKNRKKTKY